MKGVGLAPGAGLMAVEEGELLLRTVLPAPPVVLLMVVTGGLALTVG